MRKGNIILLVAVTLIAIVFSGCKGGETPRTLTVMVYNACGQYTDEGGYLKGITPYQGVNIVLGDPTGALVATAVTSPDGTAIFSEPPQDAMVTVASSYVTSASNTVYTLNSRTNVNLENISFSLHDNCGVPGAYTQDNPLIKEINVSVVNVPSEVYAWSAWPTFHYSLVNEGATQVIEVHKNHIQSDGRLTLLLFGHDEMDNIISYGLEKDIDLNSISDITVDLGMTDFSNVPYIVSGLPQGLSKMGLSINFKRGGVSYVGGSLVINSPTGITQPGFVKFVSGLGDSYSAGVDYTHGEGKWPQSAGDEAHSVLMPVSQSALTSGVVIDLSTFKTVNVSNLPQGTVEGGLTVLLYGQENLSASNFIFNSTSAPSSFDLASSAGLLFDAYTLGGHFNADTDGDGVMEIAGDINIYKADLPPGPLSLDFDTLPMSPSSVSVTGVGNGSPLFSILGGDSSADSMTAGFGYNSTENYYYDFSITAPAGSTELHAPQLPDSLAVFRPDNYDFDFIDVGYFQSNAITGYEDKLKTDNEALSGIFNSPANHILKASSRRFGLGVQGD